MRACACVHVRAPVCARACASVRACARARARVCVCVCVCVFVFVFVSHSYYVLLVVFVHVQFGWRLGHLLGPQTKITLVIDPSVSRSWVVVAPKVFWWLSRNKIRKRSVLILITRLCVRLFYIKLKDASGMWMEFGCRILEVHWLLPHYCGIHRSAV